MVVGMKIVEGSFNCSLFPNAVTKGLAGSCPGAVSRLEDWGLKLGAAPQCA